jgi:hypothetical protein
MKQTEKSGCLGYIAAYDSFSATELPLLRTFTELPRRKQAACDNLRR